MARPHFVDIGKEEWKVTIDDSHLETILNSVKIEGLIALVPNPKEQHVLQTHDSMKPRIVRAYTPRNVILSNQGELKKWAADAIAKDVKRYWKLTPEANAFNVAELHYSIDPELLEYTLTFYLIERT